MRESASCPVIGVVEAGVLATSNKMVKKDSNILILGTKATVHSKAYETKLQQLSFHNLQAKATGLFVSIVEEDIYNGAILNATFAHYFKDLQKPDAIILGCTHFPLIADALQEYFGEDVVLIHSGEAIVEHLGQLFSFTQKYENPKLEFFASENPDALRGVAKRWLALR
jgi:glutamate racemase